MSATAQRVAVVGAGAAGLATAKVLSRAGHRVTVFEKAPDVGGVWSATRRYPGVTTQSPRDTYCFSDFPMPKSYPEWPNGEQVQRYFADYAAHFGLEGMLRLSTTVQHAAPTPGGGWRLQLLDATHSSTEEFDSLVVANGVFCEPSVPVLPGADEFAKAGGQLRAATEVHDLEEARGRQVLVIGYGKSACDIAVALAEVAGGTSVIARQMLWKVPRKVHGIVNFKYLLLTRMGEALFRFAYLRGPEKFLHGVGNPLRRAMVNSVGSAFVGQYKIKKLGLVPPGTMEDIVKGAIGLVSEGFYEAVADGSITVHRDRTIRRLRVVDGRPSAELDNGEVLPADLVVSATGFRQGVPFLDAEVRARLFDERDNFMLYRQVLPVEVPHLYFAGYNSSFFSPLNAEMAALWIAGHLADQVHTPDTDERRQAVTERLAFMDVANHGHHSRGTKIIPFSLHNVDELLGDLGTNISAATRARHWLAPVTPRSYQRLTKDLTARAAVDPPSSPSAQGVDALRLNADA